MNIQKLIYLAVGVALGFFAGFYFANSVNRGEGDKLRAELARLRATGRAAGGEAAQKNAQTPAPETPRQELSPEELRRAIAKGDASPGDITLQRNLGRGLYLYAMNTGDPSLLPDAVRILKRAHDADPKDYDTLVGLGNALFDMAQNGGDAAQFDEARKYYAKALEMKPGDVNVRTDLGLTYYFGKPSDPKRAIKEYRRSLASDPRHEMTLQNLSAALVTSGELDEARKRIDELEKVNSANAALPNLRAQLALKRNESGGGNN